MKKVTTLKDHVSGKTLNVEVIRSQVAYAKTFYPEFKSDSPASDGYTRFNPFTRDIIATSGTIEMAEKLGAHWFLDVVASYMPQVRKLFRDDNENSFFVARLSKLERNAALFTLDDGNDNILIAQEISYTDCPDNLRLYLQTDGEYWCLMMPSEY